MATRTQWGRCGHITESGYTSCPYCAEIAGLEEQIQRGLWAAETNRKLIAAIEAHKDATIARFGPGVQHPEDLALWAVAGY